MVSVIKGIVIKSTYAMSSSGLMLGVDTKLPQQ